MYNHDTLVQKEVLGTSFSESLRRIFKLTVLILVLVHLPVYRADNISNVVDDLGSVFKVME